MKKIGKHIFPIFFVLLLSINVGKGQKNSAGAGLHEIGAGIGALNYTGDLSPGFNFSFFRPAGMIFYRYNISPVVSLRGSLLLGNMTFNEKNLPDPVPQARQARFSTNMGEFAVTAEYNFLNYRPKKEVYRYSPYLTGGIATFSCNNIGGFQISIPMGVGLKYRINRRLNFGAEFVARKTFTDRIDQLSSYYIGYHQTINPNDKDWYYYAGFSISWTAFSVVCPEYFMR